MDLTQLWSSLPADLKGCVWAYTQSCYAPTPPPPEPYFAFCLKASNRDSHMKNFMPLVEGNLCDNRCGRQITYIYKQSPEIWWYMCNVCNFYCRIDHTRLYRLSENDELSPVI